MKKSILFVASEMYPYVRTGGLADVISSLPRAVRLQGNEVHLILPGYPGFCEAIETVEREYRLKPPFNAQIDVSLLKVSLKGSAMPVWLVHSPQLYHTNCGIYEEPGGPDSLLNAKRFGTLSWVAAELASGKISDWRADVVHCHDWHAALTPLFIQRNASVANGCLPHSVLTVHNLAFQGHFPIQALSLLGIRPGEYDLRSLNRSGSFNFLETGLRMADHITTVSPTYAKDILTTEYGCGLDELLRARAGRLTGISNGVDYSVWHPECDGHLQFGTYHFDQVARAQIKRQVQHEFGLPQLSSVPLLTFTNRLTHQKMADVIVDILPDFLADGVQFIALGQGQPEFQERLLVLSRQYPDNTAVDLDFDEGREHRLLAGGDICLSPSRFEPCGLNPLYAMRYGSVPLVRATGGLRDSITNVSALSIAMGTANGFAFNEPTARGLAFGLSRALFAFRQKDLWSHIQVGGMSCRYRWKEAAELYTEIYRELWADNSVRPPFRFLPQFNCASSNLERRPMIRQAAVNG